MKEGIATKKFLFYLIMLILCAGFAGCANDNAKNESNSSDSLNAEQPSAPAYDSQKELEDYIKKQNEKELKKFEQSKKPVSGAVLTSPSIGEISIESYFVQDGTLTIALNFTNKSKHDISYSSFDIYLNAYQDGILIYPKLSSTDKNKTTFIKSDKTIKVITSYTLCDTDSDVVFELSDEQGNICAQYSMRIK